MLLFYGGLCVNFDIIGEISHGSNRTRMSWKHGSTQTFANSAPEGMPDWCNGYRVSVQYHFSPHWHP